MQDKKAVLNLICFSMMKMYAILVLLLCYNTAITGKKYLINTLDQVWMDLNIKIFFT